MTGAAVPRAAMTGAAISSATIASALEDPPDARLAWIRAGQTVLRQRGAVGLKLHAVALARGATTGSFYHHFTSWATYLDELADRYAVVDPRIGYELVAGLPPALRLRVLLAVTKQNDIQPLDHAMRMWAATNERAAAAVRKLDHDFLLFLRELFLDLGLDEPDAQTRAVLAYSASAAIIYPPWPITEEDAERAIRFLTQTAES